MWNVLNTLCPADQEMEEEKNPLQLQNAEIHKGLVVPQRKKGKREKKWKIVFSIRFVTVLNKTFPK
jgi:hypothetical protein